MGWFDDHQSELEAANIPREAAEDFIARNSGHEGQGGDYDRIISALGPDYARRDEESSGGGGDSGGGGGGGGDGGGSARYQGPNLWAAPRPYQPFTEQFVAPTARELPTYPGAPAWTGGSFAFDPAKIAENPAYQVRLSDTIKAVDRGAAAKGLSFTNQAREEMLQRAGALASQELDAEYGRQLGTYGTNRGVFESDRGFGRGTFESDRGFTQGQNEADRAFARATYLDRAGIHDLNEQGRFGSERSNLLDTRAYDADLWGRDRTTRQDDRAYEQDLWGRGFAQRGQDFDISQGMWGRGFAETGANRAWNQTLYGRGVDAWNQNRANTQDQWGRGMDLWNMNRTDRNDLWGQNFDLSDQAIRAWLAKYPGK